MKYTRTQFKKEYYGLWELGLLIPNPNPSRLFSVKYKKNEFDEYSRVTLKAVSINDALERACYAITYASPWRPEDIDLHAVYDEEENLLWVDEPFYNTIQKENEFRGMERREFLALFGATSAAILFGFKPARAMAGTTTTGLSGTASNFNIVGEQLYTTAGSYTWTAPTGVISCTVVCVGGGGGAGYRCSGGGGGALAWKNNIAVTPGNNYAVVVGAGGVSYNYIDLMNNSSLYSSITIGGSSSFASSVTAGGGGIKANTVNQTSNGGTYSGADGGGNGGSGGSTTAESGGGGGAGGYTGNGGNGGNGTASSSGTGGGVGLFGQGSNGTGGAAGSTNEYWSGGTAGVNGSGGAGGGGGGSNAGNGVDGGTGSGGTGKQYGGGGGGYETPKVNGGSGAIRIIWGAGRSFPSNAT